MSAAAIEKLEAYIDNPRFTIEATSRISEACGALCAWVRALYDFYWVYEKVKPLRARAEEAKERCVRTSLEIRDRHGAVFRIFFFFFLRAFASPPPACSLSVSHWCTLSRSPPD